MIEKEIALRSVASIKNDSIRLNDKLELKTEFNSFDQWMDDVYRSLDLNYPKFHKMDNLSKLGFMTCEFLLEGQDLLSEFDADKIGVVLSNKSSSLDTDFKYNELLKTGIASPAVFVYTLPNIVIGEICIRNKFKGETVFFISDKFNARQQVKYISGLLRNGIVDACIGGWVELMGDSYESFLYLVTNDSPSPEMQFTEENIIKLFNQI